MVFGFKKFFNDAILRLGSKRSRANFARLGRKFSHEATRQLGNVAKISGVVSKVAGEANVVPLKLFADAVGSGAKAGMTGIEIGKDLGAKDTRTATGRVPELRRQLTSTGSSLAGAAMFVA